ncbi:MAG: hypothetical protein COA37_01040 [Hoeflea sp.]|uniref:HEPN domain-containing protein n=1 Tax=Hoeflea sp. TaxID=1940281 RepID=UPI000C0F3E23|nr:HEPN domain-containing protein [Hoeflea sp.]PHR25454.1 MAG: hypothetical protein COA37_01040 [Hoeflea sp.]
MVSIGVAKGADTVEIAGLGVTIAEPFELRPGVTLIPGSPVADLDEAAKHSIDFIDYAAVVRNRPYATVTIRVQENEGGKKLVESAWNALWSFHLLSLAARRPCCSLYAVCRGWEDVAISAANRNIIFNPFGPAEIGAASLQWMKDNDARFHTLIANGPFNTAMRCYGNSHYLFDHDMRVMLLWSGIEGLLSVDAELTRRIALYAAIMLAGTPEEKVAHFGRVKKAYAIRSKAVHGGGATQAQLERGYAEASDILLILLSRCVELGRVPTAKELDSLAASGSVV